MRTLLAIASLAILGGLGALAYQAHDTSPPIIVHIPDEPSSSTSSFGIPAAVTRPLDARTLAEVQQHERALIDQARQTLQLRRDDMAQLHRAIDTLGLPETTRLREHRELSDRLRLLAREIELAPTQGELARLLGEIKIARDTKRHRLAAAYRTTANALPPMHRSDALAKLAHELR